MATMLSVRNTQMDPWIECEAKYNVLTAGETINIPHTAGPGTKCNVVSHEVQVPATDGSPLFVAHIVASDVRTATLTGTNTVAVKVDTVPGGSLDGMTVSFRLRFDAMAANAINSTATP